MYIFLGILCLSAFSEAARILAVFPAPFISHQITFRPLTEELARVGHEVTVITPDPAYSEEDKPANLTEIDVHDISYSLKYKFGLAVTLKNNDVYKQVYTYYRILSEVFEKQINTDSVRKVLNDTKGFDLILVEGCVRPALVLSHIFKAPMIIVSSLAAQDVYFSFTGISLHPILYPGIFQQKLHKMTFFEKVHEIFKHYLFIYEVDRQESDDNALLRRNFGNDVPQLSELKKRVSMLFMNVHHLWDNNRPVPPNIVYLGGLHLTSVDVRNQVLDKNLKGYLDSSKNGVIYVSYGSNIELSVLPQQIIRILLNVLSRVPYDVLLRWEKDSLPYHCDNIKIVKWIPQAELLKHPKIKLFITQGGLQSTDEAIIGGVPLIAMPTLGDQWLNAEQYKYFNIGLRVDMDGLTEDKLHKAIDTIVGDNSYRRNVEKLRSILHDRPDTSLNRAVWWVEYVLRHGGAEHLKAAGAKVSWAEYLEFELLLVLFGVAVIVFYLFLVVSNYLCNSLVWKKLKKD